MSKYLKILIPTIILCFVLGIFWGLGIDQEEEKEVYLGDLKILAPENSFPPDFINQFEQEYSIKIHLTTLNLFDHHIEVKTRFKNYDIVWLDHSMAKEVMGLHLMDKIPETLSSKISSNFNYLISEETFLLPYRWKIYLYETDSKKDLIQADFKKQKNLTFKINHTETNTLLAMEYFGLLKQRWFYDENIDGIKRAIKKFIARSKPNPKNKKQPVIFQTNYLSGKKKISFKKDYLEINYLALPQSKENLKSKNLFLDFTAEHTKALLGNTSYASTLVQSNNMDSLEPHQRADYLKAIDISNITLELNITPSEKIWSQAFAEAIN